LCSLTSFPRFDLLITAGFGIVRCIGFSEKRLQSYEILGREKEEIVPFLYEINIFCPKQSR